MQLTVPNVGAWTETAQSFVADAANRGQRLVTELRGRFVLNLATKHDIEVQGRLTRKRILVTLNEFLDAQTNHDEALIESVRAEVRELLQSLIAALDDEMFDEPLAATSATELDDDRDDELDEDAVDVVSLDDIDIEGEASAATTE